MLDINALIQTIAIAALPVVFAITLHEAAHGYAARHFGDPTAWQAGRISLNPLRMQVAGAGEYLVFNLLMIAIVVRGLAHFYPSFDLMSRVSPIFNICVDLYTKTILPAFTSLTFKYSSLFNGL